MPTIPALDRKMGGDRKILRLQQIQAKVARPYFKIKTKGLGAWLKW
jgi:hypothetical protein